MLDTLILILTLLLKAASLWFLAVALFALRKPKRYAVCAPRTRFACLVAARNEEAVIGALVESLKKQDYPDALYDIFVIPNNCTDDTESEALCAGAKIFRCFEPVRCKGDALHEAVAWLLPQRYDAFCVFDADNVADEQFLARMNDAFCAGAQVCKGAMRAKNPYDSWLSGCYGLYFTLFDTFFSRARMSCGLSSKLVGTGFAVHRAVLERFGGWNTSTIAEDAEFAAQCAANGVRVCFVPGALTYDEALARAFGADGEAVDTVAALDKAFEHAFSCDGPYVIDCRIDKDEFVLPMLPPGGSMDDIIMKVGE